MQDASHTSMAKEGEESERQRQLLVPCAYPSRGLPTPRYWYSRTRTLGASSSELSLLNMSLVASPAPNDEAMRTYGASGVSGPVVSGGWLYSQC